MHKPVRLNWFYANEFHEWWDYMDVRLLVLLDVFRALWGSPVIVSPRKGALGRQLGQEDTSQHNLTRWGEVRAVDIMLAIEKFNSKRDNSTSESDNSIIEKINNRKIELFSRAVDLAKGIGFTGIGIYPDWSPHIGMHLDVRIEREPGNPALWAGVQKDGMQVYVGMDSVLKWKGGSWSE